MNLILALMILSPYSHAQGVCEAEAKEMTRHYATQSIYGQACAGKEPVVVNVTHPAPDYIEYYLEVDCGVGVYHDQEPFRVNAFGCQYAGE